MAAKPTVVRNLQCLLLCVIHSLSLLNSRTAPNHSFASLTVNVFSHQKYLSMFPIPTLDPNTVARRFLPPMPSPWEPPALSLSVLDTKFPHLLQQHEIVTADRHVDMWTAACVEFEGQHQLLERLEVEAAANGIMTDDRKRKFMADAVERVRSIAEAGEQPGREQEDCMIEANGKQQATAPCPHYGPAQEQLEATYTSAVRNVLTHSGEPQTNCAPPSYAARWHSQRRVEIEAHYPSGVRPKHFFPSFLIGCFAVCCQAYLILVYLPGTALRVLMGTGPSSLVSLERVQSFYSLRNFMLGGDGKDVTLADSGWQVIVFHAFRLASWLEWLVGAVLPLSVFTDWLADLGPGYLALILKVTGLAFEAVVLAASVGSVLKMATDAMSQEIVQGTVSSIFDDGSSDGHHGVACRKSLLQSIKSFLKYTTLFFFQLWSICAHSFEYVTLAHRGHLKSLGSGDLAHAHYHLIMGLNANAVDIAALSPANLLKLHKRWGAVVLDREEVPFDLFPPILRKAMRVRMSCSIDELYRDEEMLLKRMRDDPSGAMSQQSLMSARQIPKYLAEEQSLEEAAARSNNQMEVQYGSERRAMQKLTLLFKKHFYQTRRCTWNDLQTFTTRGNFAVMDPRPTKSLTSLISFRNAAQASRETDTSSSMVVEQAAASGGPTREDARYSVLHDIVALGWGATSAGTLTWAPLLIADTIAILMFYVSFFLQACPATISIALIAYAAYPLTLLQTAPLYKQTIGKLWVWGGLLFRRDLRGLFWTVNGTHRALNTFWPVARVGMKQLISAVAWLLLLVVPLYRLCTGAVAEGVLPFGCILTTAFVALFVLIFQAMAEMFQLGLMWHPYFFVHSCAHRSLSHMTASPIEDGEIGGAATNQPTVSIGGLALFLLSFGESYHVEMHDLPDLPWIYRNGLRRKVPNVYSDARVKTISLREAVADWIHSKGTGIYACADRM